MKYILLGLFLLHASTAAPIEDTSIEREAVGANVILPQIEEHEQVEPQNVETVVDGDKEKDEDAEAAFFGMMNPMMNPFGMSGMGGMMNPMMMGGGMHHQMMPMSPFMGHQMDHHKSMQMSPFMGGMGMQMSPMMMGGGMNPMMMGGMDPSMMFGGGMNQMMQDPNMMFGGGMMNPMMNGMYQMGGMDPSMMFGGGMNQMMGGMDPNMMMMGGGGGMNPMMMDPMSPMNDMLMNPMMMGMTGMSPLSYMDSPTDPNKQLAGFHEYKNEDFPIDYTLPCSNHCACEQVCKNTFSGPCNCRCPPQCVPGLI